MEFMQTPSLLKERDRERNKRAPLMQKIMQQTPPALNGLSDEA